MKEGFAEYIQPQESREQNGVPQEIVDLVYVHFARMEMKGQDGDMASHRELLRCLAKNKGFFREGYEWVEGEPSGEEVLRKTGGREAPSDILIMSDDVSFDERTGTFSLCITAYNRFAPLDPSESIGEEWGKGKWVKFQASPKVVKAFADEQEEYYRRRQQE